LLSRASFMPASVLFGLGMMDSSGDDAPA